MSTNMDKALEAVELLKNYWIPLSYLRIDSKSKRLDSLQKQALSPVTGCQINQTDQEKVVWRFFSRWIKKKSIHLGSAKNRDETFSNFFSFQLGSI